MATEGTEVTKRFLACSLCVAKLNVSASPVAGCGEVAEGLGDLLGCGGIGGFQFDDEAALDEEVGEAFTKGCAAFVARLERLLRYTSRSKAVCRTVSHRILTWRSSPGWFCISSNSKVLDTT